MNILIISPFFLPNMGGIETHLKDLCSYLLKKGHSTVVITYQPLTTNVKGLRLEKIMNLQIHRVQWFGRGLLNKLEGHVLMQICYLTPGLLFYSLIYTLRHAKEIDVLHAHGLIAASIVNLLSKIIKKRSVFSPHINYGFSKSILLRKFASFILSSFDIILTVSPESQKDILSIGVPFQKIRIYNQWVNQKIFRPLPKEKCRKCFNIDLNEFVILFVGRLLPEKGILVLIKVIQHLPTDNFRFIIVGNGPLSSEVTKLVRKQKNITFINGASQESLAIIYNTADVVIVPSLCEEYFCRVIPEALSCGKLVIASRKGILPKMLGKDFGIIIEPKVDEIVRTLLNIYDNRNSLKYLTSRAIKYARRYFSEENAEIIERSYHD